LILWPVFFEVAAMVFASSILLNARVFSQKLGWASFGLMTVGSLMLVGVILSGQASVAFTAYPPLVANPTFYLGYLVFAVGTLLAIANFALTIVAARAEGTFSGSLASDHLRSRLRRDPRADRDPVRPRGSRARLALLAGLGRFGRADRLPRLVLGARAHAPVRERDRDGRRLVRDRGADAEGRAREPEVHAFRFHPLPDHHRARARPSLPRRPEHRHRT